MILLNVAMAAPAATCAPQGRAGGLENFLPLILIFVVFYFLLIRPQQKKMKDHQKMLNVLKRGDKVVTSGGLQATVSSLKGNVVEVEIARDVKVMVSKSSISALSQPEQKTAVADKTEKV